MYIALKSFSGPRISMAKGQEKDIQEPELIQDLLRAGYIMEKKVKKDEIKKIDEEIKEVKKNENKKDNKKDTKKDNKKNTKK